MIYIKHSPIIIEAKVSVIAFLLLTSLTGCDNSSEPETAEPISMTGVESVTSSSATLMWTQSNNPDFREYKIYMSTSSAVSDSSSLVTTLSSRNDTSYTVTGLAASTTYYFKVYEHNTDGSSGGSNTISVTTAESVELINNVTNDQGEISFEVGGYDVEVETNDEIGNSITEIEINAVTTENYLIVVANPPPVYYPDIIIKPLSEARSKYSNTSEVSGEKGLIDITFHLRKVELDLEEMPTEPPYIEEIKVEKGVTKNCISGDLSDLISTLSGLSGGFQKIFHIDSTAASKLGLQKSTAAMTSDAIDGGVDLLAALMGETFGIFDEDILTVCWGVDEGGNIITPIYCEDIELQRTFELRFTLTWGKDPRDLDSHLWTPSINGTEYHVYYGDRGSTMSPPYAELDVDDRENYGPENITVAQLDTGTYYFSVNHYNLWPDDSGLITTSEAQLKVSGPEGELHTMNVPTGQAEPGWWWNVLEVDGGTGQISIINQVSSTPPVGEVGVLSKNRNLPHKE